MKKPVLRYLKDGKEMVEDSLTYSELQPLLKYIIHVPDDGVLTVERKLKCGTMVEERWEVEGNRINITEKEI